MSNPSKEALNYISNFWGPHSGQKQLLKPVLKDKIPFVYVECGRKFGKTEFSVWMCWVHALSQPNAEVYYLAPAVKQAKELVWANNRMQTANTLEANFIENMSAIMGGEIKVNNQEMRIILPNGSFIKVDGSDNYNIQRGLKPDFLVADEYRDFKEGWIEAVRPNMLVKKSTILFVTTPPHTYNHSYYMAEECRENVDGQHFYLNLPTATNDKIPDLDSWLEKEKARLFRLDRQDEWFREYEAMFIEDTQSHILPGLTKDFLSESAHIDTKWTKDYQKYYIEDLKPRVIIEQGNTTVLAAILGYYNPFTGYLTIMDSKFTDIAAKSNVQTLIDWVDEWSSLYSYDFFKHVELLAATQEMAGLIEDYSGIRCGVLEWDWADEMLAIAGLKEMIKLKTLKVSDKCENLIKQCQNYVVTGENRELPKNSPELVDCLKGLYISLQISSLKDSIPTPIDPEINQLKAIYGDPDQDGIRFQKHLFDKYGLTSWEDVLDSWEN